MRLMNPDIRHVLVRCGMMMGIAAVSCTLIALPAPAAGEIEKKAQVAPKEKTERGWFVAFDDGMLALQNRDGLVRTKIPADAKTFVWMHGENRYKSVDTTEAMNQLKKLAAPVDAAHADTPESMNWRKAGTGLVVKSAEQNVTIHIGENRPPFVGKFVALKNDVLVFRLTNPSAQYQRSYGNTLNFKMREDIPVYESIDGGAYKWVGTPRTALSNVKEGANITVYHYYKSEDDEFYLILTGVSKQK